ncbi:hypothetical protein KUTeg_011954 [Tegillarca granosa]|uniref:Uncharacterized protein n=1 Tax=Tegillarca granosa TaxID=220873 RepID=A0ABQ9EY45_TEGGR|nr:hypothetical protein KUTeg_011954 [Tegillarca granosa]
MNVYSTSGFYKAPISKAFLGTSLVSSFALTFPFLHYRHLFLYKADQIINRQQSYMAATTFVATCLELLTFYGLQMMDIKLDPLPSGPLCILYAFLIPYYFDLPRVAMGHILGVPVTGKSLVYILALQAGSGSKESVIVAACGILSGLLWRINFLKLQTIFRIPSFLAKIFQTVFGNVLDSPPPSEENLPMGATLELQRQERYDQLEQQMIWQSMQQQHGRGGEFGERTWYIW